jgi:hypothetical protein
MTAEAPSVDMLLRQCDAQPAWFAAVPERARALRVTDADRRGAWEFYIELASRIATQPLEDEEGVELTALQSIADLFGVGRQIMRAAGPDAGAFATLLLALLNHRVRYFTAPWHKRREEGRLADPAMAGRFRVELRELQSDLRIAADLFALMAGVPPLAHYGGPRSA